MALDSYDNLVKKVLKQSHRPDLALEVDDFILLTEQEMRSNPDESLKLSQSEIVVDVLTSNTERQIDLPVGFQSSRNFRVLIGELNIQLEYRTPSQIEVKSGVGKPLFFTIEGNKIAFDVVPDAEYTVTIGYYQELTPLTFDSQTNVVLQKYPSIYLYGCLKQAYLFAVDNEQAAVYGQLFEGAIVQANRSEMELTTFEPQITVGWAP